MDLRWVGVVVVVELDLVQARRQADRLRADGRDGLVSPVVDGDDAVDRQAGAVACDGRERVGAGGADRDVAGPAHRIVRRGAEARRTRGAPVEVDTRICLLERGPPGEVDVRVIRTGQALQGCTRGAGGADLGFVVAIAGDRSGCRPCAVRVGAGNRLQNLVDVVIRVIGRIAVGVLGPEQFVWLS